MRGHLDKVKLDYASEIETLKLEVHQLKAELTNSVLSHTNCAKTYSSVLKSNLLSDDADINIQNTKCFQPVKKGAKPTILIQPKPLPTRNSFDILSDDAPNIDSVSETTVLVGDSLVRNQLKHFGKKNSRRVYSYGGYSLTGQKCLFNKIDEFTANTNNDTAFIVQVGTNDLLNTKHHTTPDMLIEKYRQLLHMIKEKSGSNKICVLGLLPVLTESLDDIYDRKYINEQLEILANEENANYLPLWGHFAQAPNYQMLFNRGGLHLSVHGENLLCQILDDYTANFQKAGLTHQTT
jgi:hypothetical protein